MSTRARLVASLLAGLVALGLFSALFFRLPVLYDSDSYFHLAVAREYAEPGSLEALPWTRFSAMGEEFGDKEFLFHRFLALFVTDRLPGSGGGRLALAGLNAVAVGILTWLAVGLTGRWLGVLVVPFLWLTTPEWVWRMVRLRPELLALILLLLGVWAVAARRYRLAGVLAALFALAYTAFQAYLGLMLVLFCVIRRTSGKWPWQLALYALAGTGVGLVLHPHFPHNLSIWYLQNVLFFEMRGQLDVGPEIFSQAASEVLLNSLGWWLGLVVFWRASEPSRPREGNEGTTRVACWLVSAGIFGLLYLMGRRFIVYFVPFATVATLVVVTQARLLTSRVRLPWGGSVPLSLALAVCVLASGTRSVELFRNLLPAQGPPPSAEQSWAAFGRSVPDGARVVASWRATGAYTFWAPQGRYLNVLDPIFMAHPYPEQHAAQERILAGTEPDIPLLSASVLDSDHLAVAFYELTDDLAVRLAGDPRIETVYQDALRRLVRFVPHQNESFRLDWQVRGSRDRWVPYPRSVGVGSAYEGFVDARRMGSSEPCLEFRTRWTEEEQTVRNFRFSPAGPSTLSFNGERALGVETDLEAAAGRGILTSQTFEAGPQSAVVHTCQSAALNHGFYLQEIQVPGG